MRSKGAPGEKALKSASNPPASVDGQSSEAICAERDKLAQRQQRLAQLLNCPPEKIEHEVRNVLNELRLLRTLFESQEKA